MYYSRLDADCQVAAEGPGFIKNNLDSRRAGWYSDNNRRLKTKRPQRIDAEADDNN